MTQRVMWLVFVVVSTLIASMVLVHSGVKIIERFEEANGVDFVQHGMCDCCACGVIDCKKCAESGKKCCKKSSMMSRLTFSEVQYKP